MTSCSNMTSVKPTSLLNIWIQENNDLVRKWKQQLRGDIFTQDQDQSQLASYSSEFHKLLRTIQGVPTAADNAQLELTVVYNACVLFLTQMQYSEAELLLIQGLERAQEMVGAQPLVLDTLLFWRAALKSLGKSVLYSSIKQLFCLQWAIWLSTCRLEAIQDFQEELSSLSEELVIGMETGKNCVTVSESPETPLVVLEPRELRDLLQICTAIAQGVELLTKARSSEALSILQSISSLPAPRTLLANTHLLSGLCLAHMGCLQMAVQCYRKALETDSHCVCALYQSMLIYRQLGNTKAEIQALQLLHSMLMLPGSTETGQMGSNLLYPSLLLRNQSLRHLLLVPSSLSILHSLALKSVLHGRVSEGVEHYLDLLATLQSDDQHTVHAEGPQLPRLPELYLEAGAALLLARRPADCMALCDEVINTTSELLPERLVLEEPVGDCDVELGSADRLGSSTDQDRLGMLLWSGTALLLQAKCQAYLKDWKNAVTLYTRSINLLVKVQVKKKGFQPQIPCVDLNGSQVSRLYTLQRLKGLSLVGRGISFSQRNQLREALRDLQLGLQASPECVNAGQWLGEVLWRLGRKQEAVSCWRKTWASAADSSVESLPLYLQDLHSGPTLDPTELRHRIEKIPHT